MFHFLRRYTTFFLWGFVITFLVYLFVRFDADKIVTGAVIAAVGGLIVGVAVFMLERRYPEPVDRQ